MRIQIQHALSLLALAALSACSSSSDDNNGNNGSDEVEGLTTPSQLSIVNASGDENGSEGSVTAGAGATDFPANAEYNTDVADVWVYDPSVKPISQVNEILCMVSQTRAGGMVNQGPYLAQINTSRCEQGSEGGDDDGQSSGQVAEFEFWTVDSERSSNNSAQDLSVWGSQRRQR